MNGNPRCRQRRNQIVWCRKEFIDVNDQKSWSVTEEEMKIEFSEKYLGCVFHWKSVVDNMKWLSLFVHTHYSCQAILHYGGMKHTTIWWFHMEPRYGMLYDVENQVALLVWGVGGTRIYAPYHMACTEARTTATMYYHKIKKYNWATDASAP